MDIKVNDRVVLSNEKEALVLHVFQNYDNVRIKNTDDELYDTVKKKDIKSIVKDGEGEIV